MNDGGIGLDGYNQCFPQEPINRLVADIGVFQWHKRLFYGCVSDLSTGTRQLSGGKNA